MIPTTSSTSADSTTISMRIFGHQRDVVLRAAVDLGVALLPAVAADLAHRHPGDAEGLEGLADLFPLVRLDHRGHELHAFTPLASASAWPPGSGDRRSGCDRRHRRWRSRTPTRRARLRRCPRPRPPRRDGSRWSSRSPKPDDSVSDEREDQHREGARRPAARAGRRRRRRSRPSTPAVAVGRGEQADGQGAPEATDQVHADHVERVVEAEAELQADRQRAEHAGDGADGDRADRGDRGAGRGDGDQPGDDAGGGAQRGGVAVPDPLDRAASRAPRQPVATRVVTQTSAAWPLAPTAPSRR